MEEAEPMVRLTGDTNDLEFLRWWSDQSLSPLYSIVKKIAKKDDAYWLKSQRFGRYTDEHSMLTEAKKLMPIIKGSAKARGMEMRSIGVNDCVVVGKQRSIFATFQGAGEAFGVYPMIWKECGKFYNIVDRRIYEVPVSQLSEELALKLDVRIKKGLQLDNYLHQLENHIDDPYIYQTFSYFLEELSWHNLYKTYEMIRFDVDKTTKGAKFDNSKITRYGWAEPDELKRFKRAANDPHAEGSPRHSLASYLEGQASEKPDPWREFKEEERAKRRKNDPLMRLFEADALIKRIFRGWCKWKANHLALKTNLFYAELYARSLKAYISSSSHSSKNHLGK